MRLHPAEFAEEQSAVNVVQNALPVRILSLVTKALVNDYSVAHCTRMEFRKHLGSLPDNRLRISRRAYRQHHSAK